VNPLILKAADNIDLMVETLQRQIELYKELQRALLLAGLLGVDPKSIKEPLRVRLLEGGSATRPWVGAILYVRVGDGQDSEFAVTTIDKRLWPAHMREAWDRAHKQKERRPT
jgi:hypothetical protein